jgi:hypothetical protein
MNVKDLKKKRSELEMNISKSVYKLVEEFKKETNISPQSISIELSSVEEVGSNTDIEFFVERTSVDIKL